MSDSINYTINMIGNAPGALDSILKKSGTATTGIGKLQLKMQQFGNCMFAINNIWTVFVMDSISHLSRSAAGI